MGEISPFDSEAVRTKCSYIYGQAHAQCSVKAHTWLTMDRAFDSTLSYSETVLPKV